jgi:serine/threonine protein kinase
MYEHCGTPAYIAPEIFKDEGYEGFSCDVWSAGVTLHYMLAGIQPFRANKIDDLKEIILKGEYERIEDVSNEANDLISGMLQLNPNKRLSIEDILRHPWLKNVDIKKRKNLNIFTNAEKGLLSKFDVNYLSSPKEELIEVFTVSNLITKEEKEEKGATKSDILAPYNSYAKKSDENDLYSDLKIENELCRFNFKAQLSNIKYELSNNQEFDNGIIKTIYNSVEGGNKKNNEEFEKENTHTLNLSLDSIATFTGGLCDDIIKDIEELIGYDKKYLVQCLKKNEINYATATYYLMLRDEMNSHY